MKKYLTFIIAGALAGASFSAPVRSTSDRQQRHQPATCGGDGLCQPGKQP